MPDQKIIDDFIKAMEAEDEVLRNRAASRAVCQINTCAGHYGGPMPLSGPDEERSLRCLLRIAVEARRVTKQAVLVWDESQREIEERDDYANAPRFKIL